MYDYEEESTDDGFLMYDEVEEITDLLVDDEDELYRVEITEDDLRDSDYEREFYDEED